MECAARIRTRGSDGSGEDGDGGTVATMPDQALIALAIQQGRLGSIAVDA